MPANKHADAKLKDLKGKLRGAQEAADAEDAGDLAKADVALSGPALYNVGQPNRFHPDIHC